MQNFEILRTKLNHWLLAHEYSFGDKNQLELQRKAKSLKKLGVSEPPKIPVWNIWPISACYIFDSVLVTVKNNEFIPS